MLLCFKLVTQPRRGRCRKKQCNNSPSHEPNVHSFVVFCLRVGKPTGSHHHRLVSRFNALWGLPLFFFFFLFRHKYLVACYLCLEIICMEIHLHQQGYVKQKRNAQQNIIIIRPSIPKKPIETDRFYPFLFFKFLHKRMGKWEGIYVTTYKLLI